MPTLTGRRDVDKLLPITDGCLAQLDKDYLVSGIRMSQCNCDILHDMLLFSSALTSMQPLQDKHGLGGLFNELMANLLTLKPLDPVQYIIDSVEFTPEFAKQVGVCRLVFHAEHADKASSCPVSAGGARAVCMRGCHCLSLGTVSDWSSCLAGPPNRHARA